jgi:hypothetical protein
LLIVPQASSSTTRSAEGSESQLRTLKSPHEVPIDPSLLGITPDPNILSTPLTFLSDSAAGFQNSKGEFYHFGDGYTSDYKDHEQGSIVSFAVGAHFPQEKDDIRENMGDQFFSNTTTNEHRSQFLRVLLNRDTNLTDNIDGYTARGAVASPGLLSSAATSQSDVGTSVSGDRFECPGCKKKYKLRSSLRFVLPKLILFFFLIAFRKHEQTHRANYEAPRQYSCATCGRGFQFPKDLKRHEKTHDPKPDRPHKCTANGCFYVQKGFVRRDHLLRHFRDQHGGDKSH